MIIVSFNCQSSSAASSIGVGHNNSQHNSEIHNSSLSISNDQNKFAILNFDDGWKSHYQIVKPILDKYDFKSTFYIVCNYVEAEENEDGVKEE